ncbi:hypothetical protein ABZ622_42055, partial [Streptomyces sp. NPDC007164]
PSAPQRTSSPPSHHPKTLRRRPNHHIDSLQAPGGAQRFLSAFSGISPRFRPRRHLMTAPDYRTEMRHRFTTWEQAAGTAGLSTTA